MGNIFRKSIPDSTPICVPPAEIGKFGSLEEQQLVGLTTASRKSDGTLDQTQHSHAKQSDLQLWGAGKAVIDPPVVGPHHRSL